MFEGGFWGLAIFLLTLLWCFVHYYYLPIPERRPQTPPKKQKNIVSLNLKGTLLNPSDLKVRASEVEAFLKLCETFAVYTVTQVADDAEEGAIREALNECGALDRGLKEHRIMFCDTSPGAVAMVRQLQPHLHIE
ncbi:Conserved Plasmodium protein, related, partial [Eimeria tenella]